MPSKLSEVVTVNRQFLRSVRLDADFGRIDALQGYILQPSAEAVLETTANHLLQTQQRAFTWTGPYGGGKSSLALALASFAGGETSVRKAARTALALTSNDGVQKFFGTKEAWAVLPIVGRRASIVDEISSAIDNRLKGIRGRKPQQEDGRRDVIAELVRVAEKRGRASGVLLIIDELGKFLEHSVHANEDIGFYQELAEAASRCNGNFVVIGVLHQAFEQYALRLGHESQNEWAKVQGRYVDIPLVAGSDETVSLIGRALHVEYKHPSSIKVAEQIAKVIRKRRPSAASNIKELLDACWPLHPVTAAMLGPASKKRFGQNERSVFSFLSSAEPLGFTEVLSGMDGVKSYYWPPLFWDYLCANFEPAILASSDGHRWAACAEAIERTEARFSHLHVALVKTVGLIELLRNGSGLAAEKELLSLCVEASSLASVEDALAELVAGSILVFRKHLDAYGIYAGSDFDIEAALRNAKGLLGGGALPNLDSLINFGPITARRHYWTTGAMRWFSRMIIKDDSVLSYVKNFKTDGSQCGEFLLILGGTQTDVQVRNKFVQNISKSAEIAGLILGAPSNADRIIDLVAELSALEYVRVNSKELYGDSIAMREITARLLTSRSMLSDELRDSFHNATWYYKGRALKRAQNAGLSHLASDVAEEIFSQAPHVHSELVNRDVLSSNAAKALRELLHRMLTAMSEPNLGFTSFSADAGLYYTVVRPLGIHQGKHGAWKFSDPSATARSDSLKPAWDAAKALMLDSDRIISLSDLYSIWSAPPFGIKAGLLPIFAVAFFLGYRNQLALYVEGTFRPDVTEADIDEWLQDPKRIGWRFVHLASTEKRMLKALSSALSERLGSAVMADALDSARALVTLVYQLPVWTRRTELISQEAKDIRRLLLDASDPHKVLFADLPLVLDTSNPDKLATKIAAITGELTEAFGNRLRDVEKRLFDSLDHDDQLTDLNGRGRTVAGIGADFKLDAFAMRLSTYAGSLDDIEGLLMLANGKPSKDWTDRDVDAGEVQLLSWAMEFRRLEALAEVRDRRPTRRAIGVVFGSKRTVTGTFDVSKNDSVAVQALAKELLAKMAVGNIKREVFLAAIAEVGAIVFENSEPKGRKLTND